MDSNELRKKILQYLREWERSGKSELPEAGEIADKLKIHFADVLDQFDILHSEGAIEKYGRGEKASALITGHGKAILESLEKNTGKPATSTSTEPTGEAIDLLEELVSGLSEPTFNVTSLPAFLRKYKHAIRLLGMDEDWVSKELNGYPKDATIPSYRDISGETLFVSPKDHKALSERRAATLHVSQSVSSLISVDLPSDKGEFYYSIGEPKKVTISGYGKIAQEVGLLTTLRIRQVLRGISEALFDRISKELITLKFGKLVDSLFKDYQSSVDGVIANLGIENYLKVACQDLLRDDEASWQNSCMACRNIIHKLSAVLWQVSGDYHPHLESSKGQPMKVTQNEHKNRIRAYLYEKGIRQDDILWRMLDPLYSMCSAAKSSVTFKDAQRSLILTYIFLGEMVSQTDMRPVVEVRKKASDST